MWPKIKKARMGIDNRNKIYTEIWHLIESESFYDGWGFIYPNDEDEGIPFEEFSRDSKYMDDDLWGEPYGRSKWRGVYDKTFECQDSSVSPVNVKVEFFISYVVDAGNVFFSSSRGDFARIKIITDYRNAETDIDASAIEEYLSGISNGAEYWLTPTAFIDALTANSEIVDEIVGNIEDIVNYKHMMEAPDTYWERTAMRKTAYTAKIFIGDCLAPANGEWIQLPSPDIEEDVERVQDEIAKNNPDNPEGEYIIADWEGLGDGDFTYHNPVDIDYLMQEIDDLNGDVVDIMLDAGYSLEDVYDYGNDASILYDVNSDFDLGWEIMDLLGGIEYADNQTLQQYFDYEAFGRDCRLGDGWTFVPPYNAAIRLGSKKIGKKFARNVMRKHIAKANTRKRLAKEHRGVRINAIRTW